MTKKTGQMASVQNNQLHINLVIDEPYLVEHFGSMEMAGSDLTEVIPNYLRLYTKIVDDASPRATELTMANSIDNMGLKVESSVGKFIDSMVATGENMDKFLKRSLGEHGETHKAIKGFQADLLEYIDKEESPFNRLIATKVSQSVEKAMKDRQLTPESITTAIESKSEPKREAEHKETLEILQWLKTELSTAKRVSEVVEGTTKKGYPYEDLSYEALSGVAEGASDLCENTSKEDGLLGRPAGDFVVTHTVDGNPRFKLVYEAKAGKDMTKAKWLKEADVALPNRDAKVFVGLAREKDSVPGKAAFTMIRDNVLIMHFDPEANPTDLAVLKVVYSYALSIGRSSGQKSTKVHEAASELRSAIDELKKRYSQAKTVEKHGLELKLWVEDLAKRLPTILSMLEDADSTSSGGEA